MRRPAPVQSVADPKAPRQMIRWLNSKNSPIDFKMFLLGSLEARKLGSGVEEADFRDPGDKESQEEITESSSKEGGQV